MSAHVGVLALIDSHRDSWGDLDAEGWSLEQARLFALRNPHPDYDSAVQSQACNLRSSDESLRNAGRVPVIYRERRHAPREQGGAA